MDDQTPQFVTDAHLNAVRDELRARQGQHEAEVSAVVSAVQADLRISRNEQKAAADKAQGTLDTVVTRISSLETKDERDAWHAEWSVSMRKRIVTTVITSTGLAATILSIIVLVANNIIG